MVDTVHLYVYEGYADWEPAFAIAGIHNPQFQREPGRWQVCTVANQAGVAVRSMGGINVLPDLAVADLKPLNSCLLIMPGGPGWDKSRIDDQFANAAIRAHQSVIELACLFLDSRVPVAAICGATAGLARAGRLDACQHTSNALTYLQGTGYAGAEHYVDEPVVKTADGLITAGGMSAIEFAREIFAELQVYDDEALEAWYQLYKTGHSKFFARLSRAAQEHV